MKSQAQCFIIDTTSVYTYTEGITNEMG